MTESELEKIIAEIERSSSTRGMPVRLVAVDGHGGSGKSTVANKLAKMLKAEIIHTDNFASWDNPVHWSPRLIEEVLKPIKHGAKALNYARSSWTKDHHPESIKDQPVTPTMILEGVSSARKEFRPYLSYAIWVETPRELCLQRGIERDGEAMRTQWEKWLAEEDEYLKRDEPQSYANIIVSGV